MIKKHAKAEIEDISNPEKKLGLEINFSLDSSGQVKLTLNEEEIVVDMQKLWEFVYTVVTPDLADKIVPVRTEEREVFSKQHYVKVQKDLKVGDTLVVNCQTDVRKEVADAMRRDLQEKEVIPQ